MNATTKCIVDMAVNLGIATEFGGTKTHVEGNSYFARASIKRDNCRIYYREEYYWREEDLNDALIRAVWYVAKENGVL